MIAARLSETIEHKSIKIKSEEAALDIRKKTIELGLWPSKLGFLLNGEWWVMEQWQQLREGRRMFIFSFGNFLPDFLECFIFFFFTFDAKGGLRLIERGRGKEIREKLGPN